MKPNSIIHVKMSQIEWDDENALTSLPSEIEREYEAGDFENALMYIPEEDDYMFDEDIAADQLADKLSDEFNFCINHISNVEFSY